MGLGFLVAFPTCTLRADDQKSWHENEFKKLEGCWTTFREENAGADKIRRSRVDLEFAEGKLRVFLFDEKGAKQWDGEIKMISAEEIKGIGLGSISRLNLRGNETQKVEVYYAFVGDKLILVGRIGFRPWEGFHVSGEYKRAEKPK